MRSSHGARLFIPRISTLLGAALCGWIPVSRDVTVPWLVGGGAVLFAALIDVGHISVSVCL